MVEFLHGDLVGSTRAVTDSSGAVVGAWDYSMFGVVTTATGGASGDGVGVTRFLFAGEYLDDTGLYYLRARFYDPVTASFLSVDPALSVTGSPYAYASGNPLQLVDPLGLWPSWGDIGDGLKSAASATGNWIADNKGMIIGTVAGVVVGAGCLAITAGAGSVACAALGGAVGGALTYAIDTPRDCWTAGGFFVAVGVGAFVGGVTAGLGEAVAPMLSKGVTAVASRATQAVKSALGRVTAVIKPRSSVLDDALEGACSFAGFTAVVMADGSTKAIEDIEVGDEVLAEDPVTGERGAHRVSHVWAHDDAMVDFEVDGGVVTTTEDHPFWNVTDGRWEGPQDFDEGDKVLTADGNMLVTGGLVPSSWITGTAFNLTVEDLHTYFVVVADEGILVHNTCPVYFRGAEPGEAPSFVPKPHEYKVTSEGFVAETHGVSVFDDATSMPGRLEPHALDPASIPDTLQVIQRGKNPSHFEIVPAPGVRLTPEDYANALCGIVCR